MNMITFSDFNFVPQLQAVLDKAGFTEPTDIQKTTIPHIIEGKDVAGLAQTGTGKTAAFLLPLMERIFNGQRDLSSLEDEAQKKIISQRSFQDWQQRHFVLILVPTRELAEQIVNEVQKFSDGLLRSVAIYGGTSYEIQKKALKEGVDFVVATPGRLIDLYKENYIDLKQVRAVVFDEADRMFDMGFKDDMVYLLQRIPKERQFLVYSATLNFDVLNVAYRFGADPIECNVSRDQAKADHVEDTVFHVGDDEKPTYLLSILNKCQPRQTIIFSNFKSKVERIAKFLNENGHSAAGISSMLTQAQRNRVLDKFKAADNDCNILVATDVAARGLDIKGVDMVVNFELPSDAENYVHRIGRTGRAGEEGKAFAFSGHDDVEALGRIEEYLGHKVEIAWLEDQELIREHGAFPGAIRREIKVSDGKKSPRPRKNTDTRRKPNDRAGGRRKPSSAKPKRHQVDSLDRQGKELSQNNKKKKTLNQNPIKRNYNKSNTPSWKSSAKKENVVTGFLKKFFSK